MKCLVLWIYLTSLIRMGSDTVEIFNQNVLLGNRAIIFNGVLSVNLQWRWNLGNKIGTSTSLHIMKCSSLVYQTHSDCQPFILTLDTYTVSNYNSDRFPFTMFPILNNEKLLISTWQSVSFFFLILPAEIITLLHVYQLELANKANISSMSYHTLSLVDFVKFPVDFLKCRI